MIEQRYKGSRNYETWLVLQWINSDEAVYLNTLGLVRSVSSTAKLAQALKQQQQNPPPNSEPRELQNVDLDAVDWLEIAKAVLEDAKYL